MLEERNHTVLGPDGKQTPHMEHRGVILQSELTAIDRYHISSPWKLVNWHGRSPEMWGENWELFRFRELQSTLAALRPSRGLTAKREAAEVDQIRTDSSKSLWLHSFWWLALPQVCLRASSPQYWVLFLEPAHIYTAVCQPAGGESSGGTDWTDAKITRRAFSSTFTYSKPQFFYPCTYIPNTQTTLLLTCTHISTSDLKLLEI